MWDEFDLKFSNGGDFCMRVRESERGRENVLLAFFGGGNRKL